MGVNDMEITEDTLADLEADFKVAEMYRPKQSDLLSEIFLAYSQMEQIFYSLKRTYEREARYQETKIRLTMARDEIFRHSDANPLKPMKIRSNE